MKIFLVDDDSLIRQGIRKILEKNLEYCEVAGEAQDGEMALSRLEEINYDVDLLITDIRMPVMDGIELIKRLGEKRLPIKMVTLSGYDDFEYVRNAFLEGAVDYLLKPVKKKDLLEMVSRVKNQIEDQKKEQKQKDKSNRAYIESFVSKLINHEYESLEAYEKDILGEELMTEGTYRVMVIQKDCRYSYSDKPDTYDYTQVFLKFAKQIQPFLESSCPEISLYQYTDRQSIVLLLCEQGNGKLEEEMKRLYEAVSVYLKSENETCTAGVSREFNDILKTDIYYQEALEALEQRFFYGGNRMFSASSAGNMQNKFRCRDEGGISRLSQSLELCSYPRAKEAIKEILEEMEKEKVSPAAVRENIKEIFNKILLGSNELQEIFYQKNYDMGFYIRNLNTCQELKQYLNVTVQSIIFDTQALRKQKSKRRIEMAKKYIQENYQKNITLYDVAQHIDLNASYFSHLFKMECKTNFSDYLLDIRLEESKKLLSDPTIKIYEVGELVGYEDAVSFSRVFKKRMGISPKEYRNSVT